mmetsp:Transcript_4030/g.11559  ORF Transcript_4030/g.11559 Transcript_4030/m.11559 type:complete len:222 (+) Transcript_4030:346-1011(+)
MEWVLRWVAMRPLHSSHSKSPSDNNKLPSSLSQSLTRTLTRWRRCRASPRFRLRLVRRRFRLESRASHPEDSPHPRSSSSLSSSSLSSLSSLVWWWWWWSLPSPVRPWQWRTPPTRDGMLRTRILPPFAARRPPARRRSPGCGQSRGSTSTRARRRPPARRGSRRRTVRPNRQAAERTTPRCGGRTASRSPETRPATKTGSARRSTCWPVFAGGSCAFPAC